MKFISILLLFTLAQSLWSQEAIFSEEDGFLKVIEMLGNAAYEGGEDLKRVTYIHSSVLSSIQITVSDGGRPTVLITTKENIAKDGSNEFRQYTVLVENLKKAERQIDQVLSRVRPRP